MRIIMAAIAAVLITLTFSTPANSAPLESIERKGNVIRITDAESYAFYYQYRAVYTNACGETREVTSRIHNVDRSMSTKMRVRNLPGTWKVSVSVIRGYGTSLMVVKRYVYEQS